MIHRTLAVAGILAVLAGGLSHARDACAMPIGDHECCAQQRLETAGSCCASTASEVAHSVACGCDHHREVVALVAMGVPGPNLTEANAHAAPTDRADVALVGVAPWARIGDSLRAHPPPPVFLLDCTFLT